MAKDGMNVHSAPRSLGARLLYYGFPAFFVCAGIAHFANPGFYAARLPPGVPARVPMVVASGIVEVVLGVLSAVPRTRPWAPFGILLVLLGAIGANVLGLATGRAPDDLPVALQWLRVLFLVVLALWAFVTARRAQSRHTS
jgi:uncharacterized membrane protein